MLQCCCRYIMQTYARPELVFTHGEGARLYDAHGKEYLDFAAGIAVNALGEQRYARSKLWCAYLILLYNFKALEYNSSGTAGQQILVVHAAAWCTGHSDPRWLEAVVEQAGTLTHTSNLFHSVPQACADS